MQLTDASIGEILGMAGYDWVALDLEHGRFAEDNYPSLFRAIENGGSLPFARVGQISAYAIKAVLDAGACGVILPMIESAKALSDAISWAHYPPRGVRGVGYSRANLFGQRFNEYLGSINPIVVAQIEHINAVKCIGDILKVPRLDAVMVGPYDLSASMGLTEQFDHPEFRAALASVLHACREHGVASGVHIVLPEKDRLQTAIDEGHRFIAYGTDAVFIWSAAVVPDVRFGQ